SAVAATQTMAATIDERTYFVPSLSYINADSDRTADNDFGLLLGLGKQVSDMWNIEFSLATDNLDFESTGNKYKQRGMQLDGLYMFDRSMSFSPYGVIGAGLLRTEIAGDSDNNAMVNAGLGVMHSLTDSGINLRGDVRYRLDDDDRMPGVNRFGDWMVNVGLMVPFGSKNAPVAAVVAAPVVAQMAAPAPVAAKAAPVDGDSDADGVKDSVDSCPNTPAGAKVDAKGCELDGDNDGVVDSRDSCPNTPAGAKVDAKGCELDGDNDGVVDSRDKCPDTQADARVDSKGCELAEVIVLKGVNFETGSAKLTEGSEEVLNDMAETLVKYPAMVVEVSGHTDNTGSAKLNNRLSQQRADSVVAYLVAKGVKSENLKAKGYGSNKPAADNATAAGRSVNRRVELHILRR
ncbi:MAG: OmpA family protein, partial [Pseudomonadota bacterium]|nr:OmpA family protein [Pseudomonadota bacterium]